MAKAKKAPAARKTKKPVTLPKVVGKATLPAAKHTPFSQFQAEAAGRKIVLHIGCGMPSTEKLHKKFSNAEEWFELRLDIDPRVAPHIVADMVDMHMIPDSSVNAIWSSHNIEHLYPHVVPVALKEFYRVMAPEGFILLTMPDIQTVATYVAHGDLEEPIYDSPAGPIAPIDIIFGLRQALRNGHYFMAHRTAFTAKSLGDQLREAGFSNVRISREWINLWGVGYKYPPGHPMREEKMEINESTGHGGMPKLPEALPVNRSPHPGAFVVGKLTDELNMPPKIWQPLGLKKPAS